MPLGMLASRANDSADNDDRDGPPAVDPATGWTISPIVAASLCIKPRGLLTPRQAAKVDALKNASAECNWRTNSIRSRLGSRLTVGKAMSRSRLVYAVAHTRKQAQHLLQAIGEGALRLLRLEYRPPPDWICHYY